MLRIGNKMIKGLLALLIAGFVLSCFAGVPAGYYGPISRHDTLWRVAVQVRPSRHVSVQQTMLALVKKNPWVFKSGNINGLRAGYLIQVPTLQEIQAVPWHDAIRHVYQHNQNWSVEDDEEAPDAAALQTPDQSEFVQSAEAEQSELPKEESLQMPVEQHSQAKEPPMPQRLSTPPAQQSPQQRAQMLDALALQQIEQHLQRLAQQLEMQEQQQQWATQQINVNVTQLTEVTRTLNQGQQADHDALAQLQLRMDQLQNQQADAPVRAPSDVDLNALVDSRITQATQVLAQRIYKILITLFVLMSLMFLWLIWSNPTKQPKHQPVQPAQPTPELDTDEDENEYDFMGSVEGVPAQIDLARAYLQMGDRLAAEKVLNWVLQVGDAEQQATAKALLESD